MEKDIIKNNGVLVNGVLYSKEEFREFIQDLMKEYKKNKN